MGNKGEPGTPGLPGFSGPKGPAVSTALLLTLPSHVVARESPTGATPFLSCVCDLRILPNLTFDLQGPHGPVGPEGKQVGNVAYVNDGDERIKGLLFHRHTVSSLGVCS